MICKEITLRIGLVNRLIYIEEIVEIDISQLKWIIIIQEGFSLFLYVLLVHESKVQLLRTVEIYIHLVFIINNSNHNQLSFY